MIILFLGHNVNPLLSFGFKSQYFINTVLCKLEIGNDLQYVFISFQNVQND